MGENVGGRSPDRDLGQPNPGFNAEEVLRTLAGFMAQQMNQNPVRNEDRVEGCSFDQFNRQHPANFNGKTDAVSAENWILDIGELFRVLWCTDEQKVMHAAYKLSGEAKRWWISRSALLEQELWGAPITWERFKMKFLNRYFPRSARDAKAREFANLVQGSISVEEYAARFMELSRFAPHLIPDKDKKAQKFEEGLHPRIFDRICSHNFDNWVELVERAAIVERSIQRNATFYDQQKKRPPQQGSSSRDQPQAKRFVASGGQWKGQGSTVPFRGNQGMTCPHCKRFHPGQDCRMENGTCYLCGRPGHYARDCPAKQSGPTRMQPPAPARNGKGLCSDCRGRRDN